MEPRGESFCQFYPQASYHKFYSFLLTGYDRVVFLDSDGIPLRDLEHLFRLRLGAAEVAAPQAYWFKQEGVTAGSAKCPGRQVTLVWLDLLLFVIQRHFFLFYREKVFLLIK